MTTYGDLPAAEWQRIRDARPRAIHRSAAAHSRSPTLFAELQRAHVLLAVVSDHMLYSTPYKVYDYMAAGRPILGLAPRGAALYELLADSGAGVCVEPDDAAGIEQALEQIHARRASRRCARASIVSAGRTSRCNTAR